MAVYTAGQVLTAAELNDFACDSLTVDTNVLVVDKTNNRVGVGTATPSASLEIRGSGNPNLAIVSSSAGDPYIQLGDSVDTGRGGIYYDTSADEMQIRGYDFTARISIDSTGNVTFNQDVSAQGGTAASPTYRFNSDTDTGIFSAGADQIGFSCGGTSRMAISTSWVRPSVVVQGADGTAAGPAYSFSGEGDTGWYRPTTNQCALSINSSQRLIATSTYVAAVGVPWYSTDGTAAAPGFAFTSDTNTGIYRVAADQMGFACGGTESFRIVDSGATQEIFPGTDNTFLLGTSLRRWEEIYCGNATINTSDLTLKDPTGDALGLDFIQKLHPFTGTWKPEHRSHRDPGRSHQWLSAQDVHDALEASGVDPASTYMWRDHDDAPQSLAYGELIPVLVRAVQELAARD